VAISAQLPWLLTVMLVSVRLGVVVILTPVFSLIGLPVKIRLLFVLALSALLVSGMESGLAVIDSPASLAIAAAHELLIGGLLAFGLFAGFATFQFAGRIMDIQLGFGVAGLIDPTTRSAAPLLGTILNMTAVLTFFVIGGHRLLLKGLAFSLQQMPPGAPLKGIPLDQVLAQFGAMFVFAALLAAPVMTVVLLVDIAMSVMSRTMPQMNVFIIGLPLKILVGLIVLAISLGFLGPAFSLVFSGIFTSWQALLTH